MIQDIYDPLAEYVSVFRDRFKDIAESTFAELAAEAHVDVDANRETCRKLHKTEKSLESVKGRICLWTAVCVLSWIATVGGAAAGMSLYQKIEPRILAMIGIGMLMIIDLLFIKVHPCIKRLKSERGDLSATAEKLRAEAWEQMTPLNRLYDWDVLTRMMAKTVPRLEFDPYFTTQRLADLKETYGWDGSFNSDRSVIYSHSGLINGNPFVICRTRKMEMGQKKYTGSKTIYWTSTERGSDGRYHSVSHSQTLTASVTAPFPEYFEKTMVIYGNTAAPDLIFSRKHSGLAGKENSLAFKRKRRSLRKKARNLTNADFAMMTNEEFEVAFNTSNRNDNRQYALLFTPLAQENMMKLLKDNKTGYGDDFDFDKNRMINTILPIHIQELNLDMNPGQYRSFEYDKAKENFLTVNTRYFRAIYFSLAPLLCVPMYQQIRPQQEIYGHDMQRHSAFWEHEALANFWGQEHFKHPSCVTNCILKTEQVAGAQDNTSVIIVHAYGYRSEQRLTNVSRRGGDGRIHNVPVYWDEYLPVTGIGRIRMKEDNGPADSSASQLQRLEHISNVLTGANLDIYRRHIASKIQA